MPATSAAQEKLMQAVAHNPEFAKEVGIPQKVGKEFTDAAKPYKYPVDPKDLVVSLKDVPVKKPRGHKQYDPAKEFPGVKAFKKQGVSEDASEERGVALGHQNADRIYKLYALIAHDLSLALKSDPSNKDYREAKLALKTCEKQFSSGKPNLALIKEELDWAKQNLNSGSKMKRSDASGARVEETHGGLFRVYNNKGKLVHETYDERYAEELLREIKLKRGHYDAPRSDAGQEYTKAQVLKKIQEGEWDTSYDVVPGKHLEVSKKQGNGKSWKTFTIFVRPDAVSFADACAAKGITYDKHAYIKHVMAKTDANPKMDIAYIERCLASAAKNTTAGHYDEAIETLGLAEETLQGLKKEVTAAEQLAKEVVRLEKQIKAAKSTAKLASKGASYKNDAASTGVMAKKDAVSNDALSHVGRLLDSASKHCLKGDREAAKSELDHAEELLAKIDKQIQEAEELARTVTLQKKLLRSLRAQLRSGSTR